MRTVLRHGWTGVPVATGDDTGERSRCFYELVKGLRAAVHRRPPACRIGWTGAIRVGRFGVIAAAGEMATEWDILPWSAGEATQAAATCFMAWLAERGGIGAGEVHAGFRQVRAFFEAHGTARFAEIRQIQHHCVVSTLRHPRGTA